MAPSCLPRRKLKKGTGTANSGGASPLFLRVGAGGQGLGQDGQGDARGPRAEEGGGGFVGGGAGGGDVVGEQDVGAGDHLRSGAVGAALAEDGVIFTLGHKRQAVELEGEAADGAAGTLRSRLISR